MKEKIHNILNKDIKKYDMKLLLTVCFIFIALVAFISYKISSSYALFTDEVNGSKTIAIHYGSINPVTVLYNDGTLIINEKSTDRNANITLHGAVSKEYPEMKNEGTNVEKYIFTNSSQQPWKNERTSITSVEIGQKIYPTSTAYWFSVLENMTTGDFTNLDTKNVTDMSSMFSSAGYNSSVTSFTLTGLDSWDTSKVTNMSSMFDSAGYNATTWNVGNLSNWDTSSVTNMSAMFMKANYSATTFNISDLSSWDTSKVTNMSAMFASAGYNSSSFNIGNLSGWDTSKVTNMSSMFDNAGCNATTWSVGDLSGWDTGEVVTMQVMFQSAAETATTFNIGNLSNWDTSKVTNMGGMFSGTGKNATTWNIGNLSSWDVYNVSNMQQMFINAAQTATTFNIGNLSNWNTSNVTYMQEMFYGTGKTATNWNNIGTLKIYASNISQIFAECPKAKATINLYINVDSGSDGYYQAFKNAATASGALITVNYRSSVVNIDDIIATKSSTSNVVKGSVIS